MKKFRSVLALCLVLTLVATFAPAMGLAATSSEPEIWEGDVATEYDGGTGAKADPYQIATAEQLAFFAASVNGGEAYIGKNFVLTNDILLNDTTNWKLWNETTGLSQTWTPIGTETNPFKGNFDGAGFSVSGIYISDSTLQNQGLFGYINGSTIQNLTVKESFIYAGTNVAAVVGVAENGATLFNCKNEVKVTATVICGGGIVGKASVSTSVKNCENRGTVSGKDRIGGVVGENDYLVEECKNFGKITGTGTLVGGVAGNAKGTISRCENTEAVIGKSNVGGIIGRAQDAILASCKNTGEIKGDCILGGIAGRAYSENVQVMIRFCQNYGNITENYYLNDVNSMSCSGGILGYAYTNNAARTSKSEGLFISHCMNAGMVKANVAAGIVGGIEEYNRYDKKTYFSISSSYNEGEIYGKYCAAGILSMTYAKNYDTMFIYPFVELNDCYNNGSISSKQAAAGIMCPYYYQDFGQCIDMNVSNCYNAGSVTADGECVSAIFVKTVSKNQIEENCYYLDVNFTGVSENGTSLTYDEMIEQDSFENWDFDTVWQMGGPDGYEYPTLMKGVVDAPETAPVVESVTSDSVTLQAKEGYEYRVKGGEWQQSNVITGLEPETEYTFYQRWAEDLLTYASAASTGTKATTDAAPTTTATETATETATSATEPSETEPSATEPSATEPSATEPSATEPSATEPSATEPSATEPSKTEPSKTEPSATEPSATEPSATEPSATEPSVTEPSATEPSATEPSVTEPEKLLGDANNDNAVNMKDVLALRKFLAGMDVTVDMANSDVNEDTFVNMKDVLMMRKFLANVIEKLGA